MSHQHEQSEYEISHLLPLFSVMPRGVGTHSCFPFSQLCRAVWGLTPRHIYSKEECSPFSQLCRAVVGLTPRHIYSKEECSPFSQLCRAVWGLTPRHIYSKEEQVRDLIVPVIRVHQKSTSFCHHKAGKNATCR